MDNLLMIEYITKTIKSSINTKQLLLEDESILLSIQSISEEIICSMSRGGKLMIAGNGGSAGDAQHVAGEFINKFNFNRPGLPCIALSTDTSVITAVSNDYLFSHIFSKQIEALGKPGDVFIGITTSGNSPNIVEAFRLCKEKNITTVGLTGYNYGEIDDLCNYIIKVPSAETPRIQETHLLIEHVICGIVENSIFCKDF